MQQTEFRLLGSMDVRVDGAPITLPGAAERALLAVLLLSPGQTVAATTLVDLLWTSTSLPANPMNALQLRVSKLRRALSAAGLDILVKVGAGYRADVDPMTIDVERFTDEVRRARRAARTDGPTASTLAAYDGALRLWHGEPLADLAAEAWATGHAARLTRMRLDALAERAELALAAGRDAEVVADLGPLVADEPTQEQLAGLLMTALYRVGRQAEALETYARIRGVLAAELGLDPSPELRALHQRILRQDRTLAATQRAAADRPRGGAISVASGNVPPPVRPLIGRDEELSSLATMLGSTRLLTLVGPGGAGKTALAMALAHQRATDYPDGAWVVRLATVRTPAEVALATADALGVPLDGAAAGRRADDRVVSYLARRRLLLVLDNCEHVVDAAARLADAVRAGCPDVTVLSTSREALAVPGEVQVSVSPLAVPPQGTSPQRVLDYPAARLFAERAADVRPGLSLDEADLVAVARLTAALDGMPLAVELAAVRVTMLSPVELADRLTDRFALLSSGPRTAEARHRTLRALVDWSHELLSDAEQALFRRLAVFHGGWTLDAAEAVASGPGLDRRTVLDVLGRLIDQSMVVAEPGHPTRYRMLETLRQYAAERLDEAGERDATADQHAAHFRAVTDAAEPDLRGRGQRAALVRLREEQANLRAAMAWLTAHPERATDALHLAGALGWFWHLGRHVEGRQVLRRLAALDCADPAARARMLQAVSLVERPRACLVHPAPVCAQTARESLELFTALGDDGRAALSRVLLAVEGVRGVDVQQSAQLLREAEEQFTGDGDTWGGAVVAFVRLETHLKAGQEEQALATGRAAVAAFRALDDPWGLSAVLYHLGWGLRQFGRYAEAVPVLAEAAAVAASAGLHNTVQWALADLGVTHLHLGDPAAARAHFDRARAASAEVGDGAGEVLATYGHGLLARISGDWAQARVRFTEAVGGFEHLATPVHVGFALAGLARCDEHDDLLDDAAGRYAEVLRIGEDDGEPELRASGLEGLARLAARSGDAQEADRLRARAAAVRERFHRPSPPHERDDSTARSRA
ncbi:BTAD domain-containing putative transcriptional regulator [Pseudonocardia humida]|uniref:Winged helix-turn-helix domain-containing protein n=1 Tax=Pseudonocardia humida TaxID=2800819 RepID=A0ABT1AAQ1_9PSEU|nr:BTAD domain-containing putative transcriptional regulator [Pseudonocardia humida]MCO1659719.1 winged helix-turn-helix domain-containing protein [Pseudonocardia humida]